MIKNPFAHCLGRLGEKFAAIWQSFFRATPEIPAPLWRNLMRQNALFRLLSAEEKKRLKKLCEAFLLQKEFCGAQGFILTDHVLASIAAQACLPILELGPSAYRGWVGIIVYPGEFVISRTETDEDGICHQYQESVAGESWEQGPVILSWQDTACNDCNVVIHEFAHKLDFLNGEADGIPALHSGMDKKEWEETLQRAYHHFCRQADSGKESLQMDDYGAKDPAEFFAVASEYFFMNPLSLKASYPDFYRLLSRYYRQDPAARKNAL